MAGMTDRIFGDIPGHPPGSIFADRAELHETGVHRPLQAGISGSATEGADSIVLSGGYEDDEDHGDLIIYTGSGGRDQQTGTQTHDQPFAGRNRALAFSCMNGLPVRVIRGSTHDFVHSPPYGYSYDGLYLVEKYWHEPGRSGFRVWRFRLVEIPSISNRQREEPGAVSEEQGAYNVPAGRHREQTTARIVRNTLLAVSLKRLYKYSCQMCSVRLECPAGPYAEAAHIRPLGSPHYGPDVIGNMICLCPNHHVLFDNGAISVEKNLSLIGATGDLWVHRKHGIGREFLRYHREHYLTDP